jgi:Pro-kumamolisin, activation domain/Bacterial Ig-like domain (group 3)
MQNRFRFLRGCLAAAALAFLSFAVSAQTSNVQPRITAAIDESRLTTLRGNTHPYARPQFDRGAAPDSLPMQRMLLVLKRSPAQEAALDTLMEQQQNQSSPNYHAWLTPQRFGQQFGPADADIQTITSWLESEGFTVNRVSNGRTVIEFSGTAGQVRDAFHTEIHRYNVNNEDHWANSSDPQIPTALTPVVAGIDTLYNFPRQQMHEVVGVFSRNKTTGAVKREDTLFTFPNPCNPTAPTFCNFAVAPADFAKIYNVPNLLQSPAPPTQFNGDNVTIAIVAQSDIVMTDVSTFRSLFGLPAPKVNTILNGPDPGLDPGGAETEADLDVQWAGAVAPNATIDLVVSQSTEVSLGADLSAQYAVDNNLAPILNESFGICEFFLGTAGNTFYNQVWQQAAAQGITVTVSSGDSGSDTCNRGPGPATLGLNVSGFTSTPYNISVGGTDFNDINNFGAYWNTTPSDTPTVASAKGYIPEMTWNDTCTNQEIFSALGVSTAEQACNSAEAAQFQLVAVDGGSGGKSGCISSDGQNEPTCSGGYAKPPWQTALTPSDSARDVPDVSLFASNGFNSSFYLICEADFPGVPSGAASCDPYAAEFDAVGLGGTSASSPTFAAIMALVNQSTGSRQGNANYILYKLAAQAGASCTSSGSPASSCLFYDVPSGSTIAMPCASGSLNCNVTTSGDTYGVLSGYSASAGYDRATGLGSVNANNLVNAWTKANTTLKTSLTTLTLNNGTAVNITHGQSVPVSIGVTGTGGTPTGNVSLIANEGPNGTTGATDGVQGFVLNSTGMASGSTNALPGGTYTVVAQYSGDGTFGSSASSPPISVTVAPEGSKVQLAYELFDPTSGLQTNANATTAAFGTPALLRIDVTSQGGDACPNNAPGNLGCPTGNVALADSYNGGQSTALDGGNFALNAQGYTEDQAIDLPGGTHKIAVTYNGDNSFSAPTANPTTDTLTITPVATSTTISSLGTTNTTFGSDVSFSATLTAQNVFSSILPTGSISFFSGTTLLGSASLSGCGGSNAPGQKTQCVLFSTSSLPHGQDNITATYSGDASYSSSTSAGTAISVLYATNVSLTSSSNPVQHGMSVTFTAQITTNQSGAPPITGTVTFLSDSVSLGVVNVTNGQAQLTTSTLSGGMHEIVVQYSGDSNYAPSNAYIAQTVNLLNTTTSVTTSNSVITQGSSVTLTANVAPVQSGGPALTGTVQFIYSFEAVGGDGFQIGSAVALSNGEAQITSSALPANILSVGAIYSGDSNYSGSGAQIPQTVNPAPTFTVTANPTTIPVSAPGGSGSTVLTFTAQNGFSSNGAVTVTPTCSGLPSETTCSSGASITIPTNGTAMATIMFPTTAPSAVIPASRDRLDIGGWRITASALALACLVCAAMLAFGYREKRRGWGIALMFAVFALLAVSVGCGGGGGGGNTGPPPNPGTPVGTYSGISVTVTINGVTQTIPGLTLNVE